MIPLDTRRQMIDRDKGALSICYQCELLGIARSSLYYTPSKASNKDLHLMKELDMLYLEDPTRGTRRMTRELQKKKRIQSRQMPCKDFDADYAFKNGLLQTKNYCH